MINSSKHKIYLAIKILLTTGLLYFLYQHAQLQFSLIFTFFDYPFTSLCIVGLCTLMVLLNSWRWYRLNQAQNIPLPFTKTIQPAYLGIAYNYVLPGSISGDLVRLYIALKKFPDLKSKIILSILADRITGFLGMLILICVVAPFYLDTFLHNPTLQYLLGACFIGCSVLLATFLSLFILLSEKSTFATRLEQFLRTKPFANALISILNAIHTYRKSKLILLESICMSIATQAVNLIVVVLLGNMMHFSSPPITVYLLASVMAQLANFVPLTPGGIGIGEAAFANIIYLLNPGLTAPYATVFFGFRLFNTITYLPGIVMGMFKLSGLNKPNPQTVLEPNV